MDKTPKKGQTYRWGPYWLQYLNRGKMNVTWTITSWGGAVRGESTDLSIGGLRPLFSPFFAYPSLFPRPIPSLSCEGVGPPFLSPLRSNVKCKPGKSLKRQTARSSLTASLMVSPRSLASRSNARGGIVTSIVFPLVPVHLGLYLAMIALRSSNLADATFLAI